MATPRHPLWAELLQLLPIISLALPFILEGRADVARAGAGFLIGALLTIPISVAVVLRKHPLNPILVGTGAWLWLGALAFYIPVPALLNWLAQTQAWGLFVAAFVAGVIATAFSPLGYVACPSSDSRWTRSASLALLGFTLLIVGWAWLFRHNVRLGGGLPFILLNVARRVLARRAPVATAS